MATRIKHSDPRPYPHAGDAAREALQLADEREEISRRIRDIEHLINTSRDHTQNKLQTIPAPEPEMHGLYRHPVSAIASERPLMRRQVAAQLAQRRKNMLIFITSALLFSVFVYWVSHSL